MTVAFALQNVGAGDATNVVATLLATGGVTSPSAPQNYGTLAASGGTASQPFSFTATGSCGGTVTAVLQVQEDATSLGNITNTFALGANLVLTTSQTNATTLIIPGSGTGATTDAPASVYPSTINATGLTGNVAKVTVTLFNIAHTYPADIDVLLVGPTGQSIILMSDVGGGNNITNVTITLDDAAAASLPNSTIITSGTYKPTNIGTGDPFPAPASTNLLGTTLSVFNGLNPNGTWSLYVVDDASVDTGLMGGWALNVTTISNVCCTGSVAAPVANFTGSPMSGPAPLAVTFNDTSTGSITNLFWDFGDGGTTNITTNTVSHTYAAGTYPVTLIVTGPGGVSTNTQAGYITAYTAYQWWQILYFGSTTNSNAAPGVDADGTGQNNLFKFVAGLDPTNSAAVFVVSVSGVTNQPTQQALTFTPVADGRTYVPLFNTDLVAGSWSNLTGYGGPATNGSSVTIIDLNATESNKFYRLRISYP